MSIRWRDRIYWWLHNPLLLTIPNHTLTPVGYGVCWRDWQSDSRVVALIGLNVIFALGRWFWLWLRFGLTRWLHEHEPPR
jgi:hypothetical protein